MDRQALPGQDAPGELETSPAPIPLEQTGVRARLRRTPGGALLLRVAAFLVGLLFILLGFLLVALPGPLTIPPILVGLYIWSTEFAWADRLLERAKGQAREAWANAKAKPVLSAAVTLSGLLAVGVVIYLVGRYDLVARGKELAGL